MSVVYHGEDRVISVIMHWLHQNLLIWLQYMKGYVVYVTQVGLSVRVPGYQNLQMTA